jgi:glyoxylate/succinic semialdehyde reductase
MMGSMVGALGETLALADKSGLDQSQILDMLGHSAMSNPLCAAKGKLMIDKNYAPNFQVWKIRTADPFCCL